MISWKLPGQNALRNGDRHYATRSEGYSEQEEFGQLFLSESSLDLGHGEGDQQDSEENLEVHDEDLFWKHG